jgi:hypothetical protein
MRRAILLAATLLLASASASAPRHRQPARSEPVQHVQSPPNTPRLKPILQPSDVTIDPAVSPNADLVLVLPYEGTAPIESASLDILAPSGVTATFTGPAQFPVSQDMVWKIHVTVTEKAPQNVKLVATLTYSFMNAPPKVDTVTASLIQSQLSDLASTVKSVLAPTESSLDQYNCVHVSLQLANSDRRTAFVGGFGVLSPPYVKLAEATRQQSLISPSVASQKCPEDRNQLATTLVPLPSFPIKPGESASVTLTLIPELKVVPGTYSLILGYFVSPEPTSATKEIATAQGKITIGVPGVSDVMSLLGVPSFLLLPGALTVISFFLIFTLGTAAAQFDWKNPKFLFFAVTLSFAYAVIYPLLVAHVGWLSFDYVHGYNVYDAAVLWVGSIIIGAAVAGLARLIGFIWTRRQERRADSERQRMEPFSTDEPLDILAKLVRHHADFRLQPIRPTGRPEETVLRIPFGTAPPGQIWVTSRAIADKGDVPLSDDCMEGIERISEEPRDPDSSLRLWRLLSKAYSARAVKFKWTNNRGPRLVAENEFLPVDNRMDPLFRFDWQ